MPLLKFWAKDFGARDARVYGANTPAPGGLLLAWRSYLAARLTLSGVGVGFIFYLSRGVLSRPW